MIGRQSQTNTRSDITWPCNKSNLTHLFLWHNTFRRIQWTECHFFFNKWYEEIWGFFPNKEVQSDIQPITAISCNSIGDQLISHYLWPAALTDLMPSDCHLWRSFKANMCTCTPSTHTHTHTHTNTGVTACTENKLKDGTH